MNKRISVYDRDGKLLNEFQINFLQRKKSGLKLDLEEFYLEYGKAIPEDNIEMLIHETAPFTISSLIEFETHIHKGNDGQQYICYPKQIQTMETAIEFAKNWSLITVFHLKNHADVSWIESYGDWMVDNSKNGMQKPDSFKQFPLWIQYGLPRWRAEIS